MVVNMRSITTAAALIGLFHCVVAAPVESCPGYKASNIVESESGLSADLKLAGEACNTYGTDFGDLKLEVQYQTDTRLHVKIYDPGLQVYQVPESVIPRPKSESVKLADSKLQFDLAQDPFSFVITRKESNEILFNTNGSALIFQSQYIRLRTALTESPNLYGLGEHSDEFNLAKNDAKLYTRTLWNQDRPFIPTKTNLYGSHPVYYDHRTTGTHGVFLLNSNGMDINIGGLDANSKYLEYNIIGGIIDLYFLAGPSPTDVSKQYAGIVGLPNMTPYWALGFHQCKYGYRDVYEVAEVIANYSTAGIPLETMWTDIDYMDGRKIFTVDPARFPMEKLRQVVKYLHDHHQSYIVMTDPAVHDSNYGPFNRGNELNLFVKNANGTNFVGETWPGRSVFPDWLDEKAQDYWTNEFSIFYDPETGLDIDGVWLDMNEATNFCAYPCEHPAGGPPAPPPVRENSGRPIPGFPPEFQPPGRIIKRQAPSGNMTGVPGRELVSPPYKIKQEGLSSGTIFSDRLHANGYKEYDVHNLYGLMMSQATYKAMTSRRPGRRPLIITRSSFSGSGVGGKWFGDNDSRWEHYVITMQQLLSFSSLFQIPMVGSDVCGFNGVTNEELCSRWAWLGALQPFYRNHADISAPHQEFYLWASVTDAAKKAIDTRYRLLDYFYTALQKQTTTGSPSTLPLFFVYPEDQNTFSIFTQYFFGPSILVSPVLKQGSTSVDAYFPNDLFYDYWTFSKVEGAGKSVTIENVAWNSMPLHIRGGHVVPMRSKSGNTTFEVRQQNFSLIVAPGKDGNASGELYLDDGDSISPEKTSDIKFQFDGKKFSMSGKLDYDPGNVVVQDVTFLGRSQTAIVDGAEVVYNATTQSLLVKGSWKLTGEFSFELQPEAA